MGDERRTFARVSTYVRGHVRLLASPEAPAIFQSTTLDGDSLGNLPLKESKLPEALVLFLNELSNKLDVIVSHLNREQVQDDFPIAVEIVEISGSGVRLHADEPLAENQYLELVLVLNAFPLRLASAVGRVVRTETVDTDPRPLLVVDFTRIRETDLDVIVHFVFNEERSQIRERKWD